ncbi:MAG: hypothetical protein KC652_02425 [Cyanobacteria bacterium HKST-UBA01]|nr:hypothetical protein [Cyanobacteria bacterium HKST-UBA01]
MDKDRAASKSNFVISLLAGIICGVFFHFLLYKLSLPAEPFIYAWF